MGAARDGYLGRVPGDVGTNIISRQTYEPSGIQTNYSFTSGYVPGLIDVYINGSRLVYPTDYTATDGSTVGLTTYAQNGDIVELVAYNGFDIGNVSSAGADFTVGQNLTVSNLGSFENVNVSAAVTATSFVGTLTGNATGLTGTPSISVGSVTASADVKVDTTSGALYPSVLNATQRDALSTSTGALVYNSSTGKLNFYTGTAWEAVTSS